MPKGNPDPLLHDVCTKLTNTNYECLLKVAEKQKRSRSEVVREAVVSYLERAFAKALSTKSKSREVG